MPFSIICAHCSGHIAQGVRFNAEKLKVGAYFTTPIFSFRMKHSVCSGWLEVRTDPQNTAYVVFSGAKKMAEEGGDAGPKLIRITDPDPAEEDPFARAEKEGRDKIVVRQGGERIAELQGLSERQWRDPYAHSRKLRKVFRVRFLSPCLSLVRLTLSRKSARCWLIRRPLRRRSWTVPAWL